jgi:hypothetical protein
MIKILMECKHCKSHLGLQGMLVKCQRKDHTAMIPVISRDGNLVIDCIEKENEK